jgi:hypothetical protein
MVNYTGAVNVSVPNAFSKRLDETYMIYKVLDHENGLVFPSHFQKDHDLFDQ